MSIYLCNEMEDVYIPKLSSFQILKTVPQIKPGRSIAVAAPSTKWSSADGHDVSPPQILSFGNLQCFTTDCCQGERLTRPYNQMIRQQCSHSASKYRQLLQTGICMFQLLTGCILLPQETKTASTSTLKRVSVKMLTQMGIFTQALPDFDHSFVSKPLLPKKGYCVFHKYAKSTLFSHKC